MTHQPCRESGVLVINKTVGMTSHDVCAAVKRHFRVAKAGHVGTLDPLATGVLPVCVNEATKLVQFLMHQDKEYRCTMELGVTTDTHDREGAVIARCTDIPEDPALIQRTLMALRGDRWQIPPMFSALKQNGIPLYRLARSGATVQRQPRRISIKEIDVIAIEVPHVVFRVVCSAGTYVRTLCHEIGDLLGCGAHMVALERVRNGSFHIKRAVSCEELFALPRSEALSRYLIPMPAALYGMPEITVCDSVARKLQSGAPVTRGDIGDLQVPPCATGQQVKVLSRTGQLIGIVTPLPDGAQECMPAWKTIRVFASREECGSARRIYQ
ncbi:MAG: tRNA pseudouridine(55) synthase TruB [Desulfobacterota bacterium]|nr:tRNA pseudouridine(55) synthase TruB [Thermodesulfobacteriota bacterium]